MKLLALFCTLALTTPTFAAQTAARVLVKSKSPIVALSYAPDGKTLASADAAHRVTLTEVSSGQTTQSFSYKEKVAALAFAPDGKLLAVGVGKQIRLLDPKSDLKTAEPKRVLQTKMPVNSTLQFSADGRVLLSVGGNDNSSDGYAVNVWNIESGQSVRQFKTQFADSYAAALSPDGKIVAAFAKAGKLNLFSVASGQRIRDLSDEFPDNRNNTGFYVHDLTFSPDGKWLAGSGGFMESVGNLTLWEVASGAAKWNQNFRDYGLVIAWSPQGSRIATGTSYDTTYDDPKDLHRPTGTPIWSANGQWQRSLGRVPGRINALAWSPDGETLATGGKDGSVRLWSVG